MKKIVTWAPLVGVVFAYAFVCLVPLAIGILAFLDGYPDQAMVFLLLQVMVWVAVGAKE